MLDLGGFHSLPPDSARFQYISVFYRLFAEPTGDLVRLDAQYDPNCRRSAWFPDSVCYPYPVGPDPEITIVYPDSGTWGHYSIDLANLDLPDGEYTPLVMSARRELVKQFDPLNLGPRTVYQFALGFVDRARQPDHIEFLSAHHRRRVVLGQRIIPCTYY